jgi:hypothetical protein
LRWHLHELDPGWTPPTKLERHSGFDKVDAHMSGRNDGAIVRRLALRLVKHLRMQTDEIGGGGGGRATHALPLVRVGRRAGGATTIGRADQRLRDCACREPGGNEVHRPVKWVISRYAWRSDPHLGLSFRLVGVRIMKFADLIVAAPLPVAIA